MLLRLFSFSFLLEMELEINAIIIGAMAVNTAAMAYPSFPVKNNVPASNKIVIVIIKELRWATSDLLLSPRRNYDLAYRGKVISWPDGAREPVEGCRVM